MPTTAVYKHNINDRDQPLEQKRARIFTFLMQDNPPSFGQTSFSYQEQMDERLLDLEIFNHERADRALTYFISESEKKARQEGTKGLDNYQQNPDGTYKKTEAGTLVKKKKRVPIRFTSAQVRGMLDLYEAGYSYAEIARGMRTHFKTENITDAAVRSRIKLGMPKNKKILRLSDDLMAETMRLADKKTVEAMKT